MKRLIQQIRQFFIKAKKGSERFILSLFAGTLMLGTISCRKFVDVPPPQNQVLREDVFSDAPTATSAVLGMYSNMMSSNLLLFNGLLSCYGSLAADETYNTAPNAISDAFYTNTIPPGEPTILYNATWKAGYNYIYSANAILEALDGAAHLPDSTRRRLKGETLFCRGLTYFYLVNLFAGVPLVTTTDYRVNATLPRASVSAVYDLITSDLREADSLLPVSYPTAGRIRPNKWAATALLARVYLYQNRWAEAEAAATAVIGSGIYSLVTNPDQVFLAASNEAIWQLRPVFTGFNTAEGAVFIPVLSSFRPSLALTSGLLSAFEPADKRKVSWLKTNVVSSQPYTYPYKYKVRSGTTITEYNTVLRLAEQYLVRAEARAQQGLLPEGNDDLNKVRLRAGLPTLTTMDKDTLLAAIEQERRVELFAEWGHRWLDLKRTGRIDAVLGAVKPSWTQDAALFPIPLADLQRNPFLTQNPGY